MAGRLKNLVERDGRYYARLVVPPRLRKTIGRTELRTPLGGDRREAERNLHRAVTSLQDRLRAAEHALGEAVLGSRPMPTDGLAKAFFAEEEAIDECARNRARSSGDLALEAFANKHFRPVQLDKLKVAASGLIEDEELSALIGWAIDQAIDRKNITIAKGSEEWRSLARTFAAIQKETIERQMVRDTGEQPPESKHPLLQVEDALAKVPVDDLVIGYYEELGRNAGRGHEAFRKAQLVFRKLKDFLKHDDATKITDRDLVRFKEHLLKSGLNSGTIKLTYITAVKSVFKWAAKEKRIPSNPAADLSIMYRKAKLDRDKGFLPDEAKAILKAANDYKPALYPKGGSRVRDHLINAKRWCPWILAYTGCRIAEATFLRKDDIRRNEDGVWFFHFIPQKTDEFRDVPIHPHLIETGFLDFVAAQEPGHLFCSTPRLRRKPSKMTASEKLRKPNHPSKSAAQKVADWIRGLEVIPVEILPNHAWRHRFKTVSRNLGFDSVIVDSIQGHTLTGSSAGYGSFSIEAKARIIERVPRINTERIYHGDQPETSGTDKPE